MWAVRIHDCEHSKTKCYAVDRHIGSALRWLRHYAFAVFFAEGEMIELTPDLKPLIEQWVTLTPSQKQAVLIMVKEMNNLKA